MLKAIIHKVVRDLKRRVHSRAISDPNEVIDLFKDYLQRSLESNVKGLYIIGSFALQDFNKNLSDIDFIVTTEDFLSEKELARVDSIHKTIEEQSLQPNLNGIYIRHTDLGKSRELFEQITFFHEGQLHTSRDNFYEINPVTWTELKEVGIVMLGPKILDDEMKVNWDQVFKFMHHNINTYWSNWLRTSKNPFHINYYLTLFRRKENAWCVAGVARQLYTLKESEITSKRGACEYCLEKTSAEFTDILWDTINFRMGERSRGSCRQKRETLRFVKYCISEFNREYEVLIGL